MVEKIRGVFEQDAKASALYQVVGNNPEVLKRAREALKKSEVKLGDDEVKNRELIRTALRNRFR